VAETRMDGEALGLEMLVRLPFLLPRVKTSVQVLASMPVASAARAASSSRCWPAQTVTLPISSSTVASTAGYRVAKSLLAR